MRFCCVCRLCDACKKRFQSVRRRADKAIRASIITPLPLSLIYVSVFFFFFAITGFSLIDTHG